MTIFKITTTTTKSLVNGSHELPSTGQLVLIDHDEVGVQLGIQSYAHGGGAWMSMEDIDNLIEVLTELKSVYEEQYKE